MAEPLYPIVRATMDSRFPPRAQSSRFADRALPPSALSRSTTTIVRISPYDDAAASNFSSGSSFRSDNGVQGMDLAVCETGYAEVPGENPHSLSSPDYGVSESKRFRMHKLREPSLEDEWNDIVAEKKNVFRDWICCICSSTVLVLLISTFILVAMYISLRPSAAKMLVQDLNLTSFKLLTPESRGIVPRLESGISFLVRIKNPNKVATIQHRVVNLTLNFGDEVIGQVAIPGFKQSEKNETKLRATVPKTVARINVPADAMNLLQEVFESNVRVELRGSAVGHYRLLGVKVKNLAVPVFCKLNVRPEREGRPAAIISNSCYNSV